MEQLSRDFHWFCLRAKPRRQNVAAAHLRSFEIEVFNPQLRQRHASRLGPVWRTEPLFPNYLFARFSFWEQFRRVRSANGISYILHFGDRWVPIPDTEIEALRGWWGEGNADTFAPPEVVAIGDTVRLTGRLFHGMEATVVAVLPARQRVKV